MKNIYDFFFEIAENINIFGETSHGFRPKKEFVFPQRVDSHFYL